VIAIIAIMVITYSCCHDYSFVVDRDDNEDNDYDDSDTSDVH